MLNQFTWNIVTLERRISDGFVFTCHYRVFSEDENVRFDYFGASSLYEGDYMIPYEDLNEEICISWVKDQLGANGVAAIEEKVTQGLLKKKFPKAGQGVPWSQDAEVNGGETSEA